MIEELASRLLQPVPIDQMATYHSLLLERRGKTPFPDLLSPHSEVLKNIPWQLHAQTLRDKLVVQSSQCTSLSL